MSAAQFKIEEIDGWHEDGWCNQLVRVRARAASALDSISLDVWIPEEGGQASSSILTLSVEQSESILFNISPNTPTTINAPVALSEGQEVSFRIFCSSKIANKGEDRRQLSFMILNLAN